MPEINYAGMTSQILCNVLWQVPNWQRGLLSRNQLHQMAQFHSYGQSERGSFHKGANSVATKISFSLSAALLPVAYRHMAVSMSRMCLRTPTHVECSLSHALLEIIGHGKIASPSG